MTMIIIIVYVDTHILKPSAGVLMWSSRALTVRASSCPSSVMAYLSVLTAQTKLHAVSVAVWSA